MKKILALIFLVLTLGCTAQNLEQYKVTSDFQSASRDFTLNVLVTDELEIRRNYLFSNEMTVLTLNLINLAGVDFENVYVKLINADDLNPTSQFEHVDEIPTNSSETFEWDLTAPQLATGEILVLNNIKVRAYYETYAETEKALLLKEADDRYYESTYSYSSPSPLAVYFDTSYETVTTPQTGYKNFTANLIFFNNYTGLVDYYDNANIEDNYVERLIVGIDKELKFYNYYDNNSPWLKVNDSWTDSQLAEYHLGRNELLLYNYYYMEYETVESYGYDICDIQQYENSEAYVQTLEQVQQLLTEQRRFLWMTSSFTKVNVLRLGAPAVESDTEVMLKARIDYSYSQDYGEEGFGVIIYGTG
ncbi:hypothetical protein COX58_01835 [archaeon CG_4_10_14_0_2_um_filter_Archaea_38_6]|nr:MAG: hypothetical protein COS83_00250 [archaeon CG07_land_8_20_14_0_80_38_8]PJA22563.1 MAG: hypothetical protein COX58_01835 [archaeon CG_4_10_14_0_2_um_filter_Archaea_38_6]